MSPLSTQYSVLGTTDTLTAFPPSTASPRPCASVQLQSRCRRRSPHLGAHGSDNAEVLRPVTHTCCKHSMPVAATEELDRKRGSDTRISICRMSIRRIRLSSMYDPATPSKTCVDAAKRSHPEGARDEIPDIPFNALLPLPCSMKPVHRLSPIHIHLNSLRPLRIQNTDDAIDSGCFAQHHAWLEQNSAAVRCEHFKHQYKGGVALSRRMSAFVRERGDSVIATVVRSGFLENTQINRPGPIFVHLPSLRTSSSPQRFDVFQMTKRPPYTSRIETNPTPYLTEISWTYCVVSQLRRLSWSPFYFCAAYSAPRKSIRYAASSSISFDSTTSAWWQLQQFSLPRRLVYE
ncbi:hypothetical protein AB1N83_013023 [Pleurotus pulmonarius]